MTLRAKSGWNNYRALIVCSDTHLFSISISTTYKGTNMFWYNWSRPSKAPNQTDYDASMLSTTQHIFKFYFFLLLYQRRKEINRSINQSKEEGNNKSVKLPPIIISVLIAPRPNRSQYYFRLNESLVVCLIPLPSIASRRCAECWLTEDVCVHYHRTWHPPRRHGCIPPQYWRRSSNNQRRWYRE
jgi:hypothetical protein